MQERAWTEHDSPGAKATEHFGNEQEDQDWPPFLFHASFGSSHSTRLLPAANQGPDYREPL
jgi:hypothetical protein